MTATNQNDQPVSMMESADVAAKPQTAGQLLREARLKAGVHLAVLSVTLKVPVRQLEDLEADRLDLAKGAVFLRGLASSVCRHLNTDPAPVLALLPQPSGQLDSYHTAAGPSMPERTLKINGPGLRRFQSSRVFWGAACMLLLIGALVWMPGPAQWSWLDGVKAKVSEMTSPSVTAPTAPTAVATVPADTLMPPPAAQVPAPSDETMVGSPISPLVSPAQSLVPSSLATAPAVSASSAQAPRTVSPVPVTPPGAATVLPVATGQTSEWVFAAKDDSWLEMRNAQKAVVWMGVLKAGETTRIQSPLPVSVVIGRAQAVNVTLRGQPFDLKPHTQVTVARFEVKE